VWGLVLDLVISGKSSPWQGRIVVISSLAGKISQINMGAYCASKHAMEAVVDALRQVHQRRISHHFMVDDDKSDHGLIMPSL
jgi:NAD(P)-dependent dehydrogenase (short-subunit alcohol dehydrogenase family)